MDHSECIPTEIGITRAHTHEGEKGWWIFASEATKSDKEEAERILAKRRTN